MSRPRTLLVVLLMVVCGVSHAQEPPRLKVPFLGDEKPPPSSGAEVVELSTVWSADGVVPGGQVSLAVVMEIAEGWHVQTNEKEWEFQVLTTLDMKSKPEGVGLSDMQWPKRHPLTLASVSDQPINFFTGRSPIFLRVKVPETLSPGQYPIELELFYQACDDKVCLQPTTLKASAMLNVVAAGTPTRPTNAELFAEYRGGSSGGGTSLNIPLFGWDFSIDPTNLLLLWLIAAVGGFLLNFTPCVLPLVPIKVMSLSRAAANRRRCLLLGAVMSLGVVAFWVGLGVAIASIAEFTSTNQLFQYPWFTITVGVVIAGMAVGMLGLFTARLPQWVYAINPGHDTLHGSFGFGIMTAVLSTPCTAPLMGAAAAWAATQSTAITLSTFAAIGAGMAAPYLLLSAFPKLVDRVPRTGPASELIKQVMGLLMLAAAAYFVGTGVAGMLVEPPDPPTKMYWWVVAAFILIAGNWMMVRTWQIARRPLTRHAFIALGALVIFAAFWLGVRFTEAGPIDWVYYTPARLAEAHSQKKVVVLEFTAQWCLNCHALEQTVLHSDAVVELLEREDVAPIKVDLTGKNEAGNAMLKEVGRLTIPLLVVYDREGKEVLKSDAYTVQQVVEAITKAAGTSAPQAVSTLD